MRGIGRLMQLIGMIILPLAMLLELTGGLGRAAGLSQMVLMLVFGTAVFYCGRLLEGYAS